MEGRLVRSILFLLSLLWILYRLNIKADPTAAGPAIAYKFDQEERHVGFWGYIRDKQWDVVEGYLEPKVGRLVTCYDCMPIACLPCLAY